MKVENRIQIYEKDGEAITPPFNKEPDLFVRNVWNKPKLVEIQIGDGTKVAVRADELLKAIQNATNNND